MMAVMMKMLGINELDIPRWLTESHPHDRGRDDQDLENAVANAVGAGRCQNENDRVEPVTRYREHSRPDEKSVQHEKNEVAEPEAGDQPPEDPGPGATP